MKSIHYYSKHGKRKSQKHKLLSGFLHKTKTIDNKPSKTKKRNISCYYSIMSTVLSYKLQFSDEKLLVMFF